MSSSLLLSGEADGVWEEGSLVGEVLAYGIRNFMLWPRVLINSKFGLYYSNFLILTPTFSKEPIEKYGKNPIFSGEQHFYSYFQNPNENSVASH